MSALFAATCQIPRSALTGLLFCIVLALVIVLLILGGFGLLPFQPMASSFGRTREPRAPWKLDGLFGLWQLNRALQQTAARGH